MSTVNDFKEVMLGRTTKSGVVKEVNKGRVTVKTNQGAKVSAHNANADYSVGDRVVLQDGAVVEKISSSEGKTVYLV